VLEGAPAAPAAVVATAAAAAVAVVPGLRAGCMDACVHQRHVIYSTWRLWRMEGYAPSVRLQVLTLTPGLSSSSSSSSRGGGGPGSSGGRDGRQQWRRQQQQQWWRWQQWRRLPASGLLVHRSRCTLSVAAVATFAVTVLVVLVVTQRCDC
jgi:hypothetical protein